jgi:hypothetical protein
MPPDSGIYASQHALLDEYVRGPRRVESISALQRYFSQDGPVRQLYTGRHFERFTGGDVGSSENRVTPADVLALTFLSIKEGLPGLAVDVLEVHVVEISDLLAQIPAHVAMYEAEWSHFAPGSPAYKLWQLLCRCGGKHRAVSANKLLARKRPHLLPVYDSKVQAALSKPDSVWACLWTWFVEDQTRADAVADLRDEAGGIADVSLLRCIDVVLWMARDQQELHRERIA